MSGRRERGQASVELIGAAMALVALTLVIAQLLFGLAAWVDARSAAALGERAHRIGGDREAAVARAMPVGEADVDRHGRVRVAFPLAGGLVGLWAPPP